MRKTTAIDLTGQKFNRLTALYVVESSIGTGRRKWVCLCECGKETVVTTENLRGGHVKSCGCLRNEASVRNAKSTITHGMTKTPTYKSWRSMRDRCKDKSNPDYGGRGITVCDRWEAFEAFYEDMGERPEGCTLDRVDPNGNYEPSNCRWATSKQQMRNRRTSRIVTIGDIQKPLMEVAEDMGLSKTAVQYYFSLAKRMKEFYGHLPSP